MSRKINLKLLVARSLSEIIARKGMFVVFFGVKNRCKPLSFLMAEAKCSNVSPSSNVSAFS